VSPIEVASRAKVDRADAALGKSLGAALPRKGAVSTGAFDRVIAAVDASHYLLTPCAVVTPSTVAEVAELFAYARANGVPLTFRSGGTSLSGQASTDNILVDTRKHFRTISIEDNGLVARVGPGATVRQVNARLARHSRKLGPDPASEIACTVGGVVANNSSGMACGTSQNTYRTLRSAVIVLASGTIVDTSAPDAERALLEVEPALCDALMELRAELLADNELVAQVERQYAIKNTMGYGLNSLVDYDSPVQLLAHLMVGSEGTLGFVAEATFNTVPLLPHAVTTLLVFESLRAATDALLDIIATSPATVELMDAASLRAARQDPASRAALPDFPLADHCALLVEYQAPTASELAAARRTAETLFARLALTAAPRITEDPGVRAALWHVRKGLYATIAGARAPGTTALLEDVAVPVAQLGETCAGLIALFQLHGYTDAVIFGHAKDGNLHFLINENFEVPANVDRYRAFTEDMVDLVLAAGGTLKAEHGTGRIMAPFVERQYGPVLFAMMRRIKAAFDPHNILNPDAVITTDPNLHVRHLKTTPPVDQQCDNCVECGYCEPVCPSKDLTTTPRQRIVVQRAIAQAERSGAAELARSLRREQRYEVVQTCAVDGMCQTACPVSINTGDLVKRLRSESVGTVESTSWGAASRSWKSTTRLAATALNVAAAVPAPLVTAPNVAARAVFGKDVVPLWSKDLPKGGAKREVGSAPRPRAGVAQAVYFKSCLGSIFGTAEGGTGVAAAFTSLAEKAGITLVTPPAIDGLCCGTPWASKGIDKGYEALVVRTVQALWEASDQGRLLVVCDNSSCTEGLVTALQTVASTHSEYAGLEIVDAVDFAAEKLLPNLQISAPLVSVVLHPTCSSTRAGSNPNLNKVANALAATVTIPDDWGCCGFAGDRGLLHPELTASATRREAASVATHSANAYLSCNRTCEIGMTRATGQPYRHVLETLDELSTPTTNGDQL
jgi:D-lactate dehydrogenase